MILKTLAVIGALSVTVLCALVIWAAYELRKLARNNGWTIDL